MKSMAPENIEHSPRANTRTPPHVLEWLREQNSLAVTWQHAETEMLEDQMRYQDEENEGNGGFMSKVRSKLRPTKSMVFKRRKL